MTCADVNISMAGQEMINCLVGSAFGIDWVMAALVILGGIALAAYIFRIPGVLALVFGFALVYAFDLMAGGSYILQVLLLLLGFGLIFSIFTGIMRGVGENAQ